MAQELIEIDPKGGATLLCGITPSGNVDLRRGTDAERPVMAAAAMERIAAAFGEGRGYGLLELGAGEPGSALHPTLGYLRDIGRSFVAKVCGALDPSDPESLVLPDPDPDELQAWSQATPPMPGAELVSVSLLRELWSDLGVALTAATAQLPGGVSAFLKARSPLWNVVGRVCLHLAENKRDPELPFAFIATYVHQVSRRAQAQHLPLGRALEEYAGEGNRQKLVALLGPLSRAAEQSELIAELVESGDIYHPLAWSAADAHRFLHEIELYERAGLVVRMPDWWNAKRRPRATVSVTVGGKPPSRLGMEALLDFDVRLTLDGKALTKTEIAKLLAATEGLVFIKGRWIEVDGAQLREVLDQWGDVQQRLEAGGVSFSEAMRMLAGAELGDADGAAGGPQERAAWSEVVAGKWLENSLTSLRSSELRADIDRGAGLRAELRPYQKHGVQWLWMLRRLQLGGCLADDMGLGKTIQVLAVMSLSRRSRKREDEGTDLLVVPASLVDNWRLEIERFAPQLQVLVAHPSHMPSAQLKKLSSEQVAAHHAVITTYGTVMRTPWMKKLDWRSVVLDEAQAIKNPGAKQTRAVKALSARWRLALTGTPVENKLADLWSLFDFLNPGLLGSAKQFGRFCKAMAAGEQGGYAPLRRLVQPYILRRLKTDKAVISDLPDKSEVNAYCLLSKRQAALYRQSVDELAKAIQSLEGIQRRGLVLAFLTRLKQICNHPSQWLGDGDYEPADSGKLQRLRQLAEPIAARQHKLLVFTQYREMCAPVAEFLAQIFGRSGAILHGGTAVNKRQQLVQRFQQDERVPFMVLSLKAGGTGLNLTAASHVVHFDRWWNPAVENQATDRAYRIGQKRNVLVHKFVCRGTVEERIDELMVDKQKLSDEVLSTGAESGLTELSDEALIEMVSLDMNSALER